MESNHLNAGESLMTDDNSIISNLPNISNHTVTQAYNSKDEVVWFEIESLKYKLSAEKFSRFAEKLIIRERLKEVSS